MMPRGGSWRSTAGSGPNPPGFGHRIHTRDPRAARLMQLAHELDLDGEHCRLLRMVERVLNAMPSHAEQPIPLNIDGAIAAVCGDLGFGPEIGNGLFIISRVPGLLAHAVEEKSRRSPLRRIEPQERVLRRSGAAAAARDEEVVRAVRGWRVRLARQVASPARFSVRLMVLHPLSGRLAQR